MTESVLPQTPPLLDSGSPPPKCAICLGVCSNKCFSDSCMHEFCFSCLMEWSKIKAECPLCKKPFKSILHNIKSNEDYEEYIVTDTVPTPANYLDLDASDFLYLPPIPSRHFQFRTTFTVDTGGELAIQQMLLSHPLTTNNYNFPLLPRYRSRHGNSRSRTGVSSSSNFRRSIYALNYWVIAPPDLTGRYRDVSPEFYRNNPASRNRLVPWLNRELNALLHENTQDVMMLVDLIMDHLTRYHIRGRSFKNLLLPYMYDKTDHFLHEFFNFMRSPYDMIGYDRHITYSEQPITYTFTISDYDDDEEDSDVAIVNVSEPVTINNNPFSQPTLEVIEINSDSSHDSDVIIREAPVEVVDLLQSDSDAEVNDNGGRTPTLQNVEDQSDSTDHKKPVLPLKIRLKRKRLSREKNVRKRKKSTRMSSCSTCVSSSDSSDSSSSSSYYRPKKQRRKYKKNKNRNYKDYKKPNKDKYRSHKYKIVKSTSTSSSTTTTTDSSSSTTTSSSTTPDTSASSRDSGVMTTLPKKTKSTTYESEDNIPLSKIRSSELQTKSTSHTVTSKSYNNNWPHSTSNNEPHEPSCSLWQTNLLASPQLMDDYVYNFAPNSMYNYQYPALQNYPIENRTSYPIYQPSTSHYTGTSGYPQQHLSYTPPIDTGIPYYKSDYRYENIYNPGNNRVPMCVNIGVGTSPIKDTDAEEYLSCGGSNSPSCSSYCVNNVVKKEQKTHSNVPRDCTLYHNDSSDSA